MKTSLPLIIAETGLTVFGMTIPTTAKATTTTVASAIAGTFPIIMIAKLLPDVTGALSGAAAAITGKY